MQRSDFFFDLPDDLIAQYPSATRAQSRLLVLDGQSGAVQDRQFVDLPELLQPGDLLVLNNTRVIPARFYGYKTSGGKVELLLERVLAQHQALAHIRASKTPKPGARIILAGQVEAEVMGRRGDLFEVTLIDSSDEQKDVVSILEDIGNMPLPPYIRRQGDARDRDRYQTIYAQRPGAVAAPTAGLHFDESMLHTLQAKGIDLAYVTLHIGAGTFQPVRVDNIKEHQMHTEWLEVSEAVCQQVKTTQANKGRIIAVGTTSVRCLETAAQSGEIQPYQGETDIFITPGFQFKLVDALLTNFHLPESTLLMLLSAFAGYEHVMAAYQHAVAQRYRFFSYGDAMFITQQRQDKK